MEKQALDHVLHQVGGVSKSERSRIFVELSRGLVLVLRTKLLKGGTNVVHRLHRVAKCGENAFNGLKI